jgi:hypothetical protein
MDDRAVSHKRAKVPPEQVPHSVAVAEMPLVDEVQSPRARQAGAMLLASARSEWDANRKPGDPLHPARRQHAATCAERVRAEAPTYMQEIGAGGELVPASMLGENPRALQYQNTVQRPDHVAIEASRDRLELADKAGALEMGLDLADTIHAEDSLSKMLCHQMAAVHNAAMRMSGLVHQRTERMATMVPDRHTIDTLERLNLETCRLAGTVTRMMTTFQQGMLTIQKMRTGGLQQVVVQHQYNTQVEDGGQAVIGTRAKVRPPTSAAKRLRGRGAPRSGGGIKNER